MSKSLTELFHFLEANAKLLCLFIFEFFLYGLLARSFPYLTVGPPHVSSQSDFWKRRLGFPSACALGYVISALQASREGKFSEAL